MRRILGLLVAGLLLTGMLIGAPLGGLGAAEAATPVRITATPSKPVKGETFTITGKLATRVVRPVQLQYKSGKKWKRLSAGQTDQVGQFSLSSSTRSRSITVRVVAPKVTIGAHAYAPVTTKTRKLTTTSQSAKMSMPKSTTVGQSVVAKVKVAPVRSGRELALQARIGGAWKTVATGFETGTSAASVRLIAAATGTFSYRVVVLAWHGAGAVITNTVKVKIGAATATVVTEAARPLSAAESAKVTDYDPSAGTVTFIGAPSSLASVTVGKVITLPPRSNAASGALLKVTKVVRKTSTTVLTTEPGNLPDVIQHTPDNFTGLAMSLQSSTFTPGRGVTVASVPRKPGVIKRAGVRPESAAWLNVKVNLSLDVPGGVFGQVTGSVAVSPHVDFDPRFNAGGVESYKFGMGLDVSNDLTSKIGARLTAKQTFELGTLREVWGAVFGVVPVWVENDLSLIAEVSATGSVSVTTRVRETGASTFGVMNTGPGDLTPKSYTTAAASQAEVTNVELAGKNVGFFGAQDQLSLYSVAGVYGRVGAQADFEASIDLAGHFLCSLKVGPHFEVGVKTSTLFEQVTGVKFKLADEVNVGLVTQDCGVNTPPVALTITTSPLLEGAKEQPYSATLVAEGGVAPYTWSSAGLPDGLVLDPATGELSGTVATAGSYDFQVDVVDAVGSVYTHSFTLLVKPHATAQSLTAGMGTCVITTAHKVQCWGPNQEGELGSGSSDEYSATPVTVSGLKDVTALDTGSGHSCAIVGATMKCWGWNMYGQLGDGSTTNRFSPVVVQGVTRATAVVSGDTHTCAIVADGKVMCWGDNRMGELGNGTTSDDPSGGGSEGPNVVRPAPLSTPGAFAAADATITAPGEVKNLSGVTALAAGSEHTCALVTGGKVKCWGYNTFGELGNGVEESSTVPVDVVGLDDVVAISAGWYRTCALTGSGDVWCWGYKVNAREGDLSQLTPAKVQGLGHAKGVSVGSGTYHICALINDGTGACWGDNWAGQLGNGTSGVMASSDTPVAVLDVEGAVAVEAGDAHSCALLGDGSIKCWGWGRFGERGDGTNFDRSSVPVSVIGYGG